MEAAAQVTAHDFITMIRRVLVSSNDVLHAYLRLRNGDYQNSAGYSIDARTPMPESRRSCTTGCGRLRVSHCLHSHDGAVFSSLSQRNRGTRQPSLRTS